MNEPLKRSACHARDDSSRIRASVSRALRVGGVVEVERAAADRDRAEQKPVAREPRVQPPRVVDERREPVRARGEADPGADGADVVEGVPDAFELEQDRSRPGELGRRLEAEELLARLRVRDGVRHPAARAGARDDRQRVREREPLGRPLEAAVLVEQAGVDVEDEVADDVEPEVARLDHAGVDRADGDLVRVGAAHGRREPRQRRRRGRRAGAAARGRRSRRRRGRAPRARPSPRRERGRRSSAPSRAAASTLSRRSSPVGELSSVRTAGMPWSVVAWRLAKRQPSASAAATASRYASPVRRRPLIRALAAGRRRSPSRVATARRR